MSDEILQTAERWQNITPREHRLEKAANVLRWGAILNAVLAGLLLLATIVLTVTGAQSGTLTLFHDTLLMQYTGPTDTAIAITIMLLLTNISLLLVLMVGILAREIWVILGIPAVIIANILVVVLLGFTPAVLTVLILVGVAVMLVKDRQAFRLNPVMVKELRGRMRGVRSFVVLSVYLALMSGFTVIIYLIYVPIAQSGGSSSAGILGRLLFSFLVGIELLLIVFIAPAFTAGAITGERERQTYDLLRTTLLASPSFVIGKLESALSYILLLLFSAIPLQSIAFLFGGVTVLEVVLSFAILAVTAITLGTVGIYFSAIMPRTITASTRSYTVALVVSFGLPLLSLFPWFNGFINAAGGYSTNLNSSPILESLLIYLSLLLVSLSPLTTLFVSAQLFADQQVLGFWTLTLQSDGSTIPVVSPWISFSVLYLVIGSVLVALAVRRMRQTEIDV